MKTFSLFLLLFCATLSAQESGKVSLDVRVGFGSYTTYDDFQTIVYTIEGRAHNRSEGNVAESQIHPNLYLGLNYQLTDRLQLATFANYLFGSGNHYKNDVVIFGVTDINPVEQTFRAPAEFEIKVLTIGAEIRYKIVDAASHRVYLGTGIAYTSRSHYYRHEMDVDFGADFIAQRIDQQFTTANKSGMTIPLMFGIERPLSDRLTMTLDMRALILTNLEDKGWNAGIGLRWSL